MLSQKQVEEMRALLRWRFRLFAEAMWDPAWYDPEFHGRLCDFLQDSPNDTLVVLPRGHLKTTIAATLYPLWLASHNPNVRVLIVSNSADNAKMTVRTIRQLVERHPLWRALYGNLSPDLKARSVRWTDERACLERPMVGLPECTWEAAGIGSNVVRRHYDVIIEDDLVAPKKDEMSGTELLPSRAEIEKAINFHKLTLPLLVDVAVGKRVCVGTRWASYDLINHVLQNEVEPVGRFRALDVPAVDGEGRPAYKRFSEETLASIKVGLGTYMYNSLYLNQPLSEEFMRFRPSWTRYYEEEEVKGLEGTVVVTVDPADAPTGHNHQNYSAIVSCLQSPTKGLFVLTVRRGRFTEAELVREVLDVAEKDGAAVVRVEVDRYANLAAGFKVEMVRRGKFVVVEEVKTRGRRKEARVLGLAPLAENGLLHLRPQGMEVLENELYTFPRGTTDDVVDALAWQVDRNFRFDLESPRAVKGLRRYSRMSFEEVMGSVGGRGEGRYASSGGLRLLEN